MFSFWSKKRPSNRGVVLPKRPRGYRLSLDRLEDRTTPAVTASFVAGMLSVFGDNLDNNISISRNAAGGLLVNGGAVKIIGGTPTVANTTLMQVFGQGGNDTISLEEANGALPRANLFGGAGNDTLTGGSSADLLFGQAGNDTLFGKGGADSLFGGTENDTLTGGDADDQVFGEAGKDRMIWNPGDDTDLNEGGAGIDTVEVNGGNGEEQFTVTANGTRVRFDRLSPAPFSIDIGTSESLTLNMNGGDDRIAATGNLAALIQMTIDGGTGNDHIQGGNGSDLLLGGDGNDFIDGNQGSDTALMGAGDDVFQWDPGDGSDVVEGQSGTDTMRFNGSAGNEIFAASANGSRLLFTRNIGNIVMDTNEVERVNLEMLGGSDSLTLHDLSGTGVTDFVVNLSSTLGGTTGDSQPDTIIVHGTSGNDIIDAFGSGTSIAVLGLATSLNFTGSEGSQDTLIVNGLAGQDGITASSLPAGIVKLVLDGGIGNDTLLGSFGNDLILAGDGDDFVDGQQGDDRAFLGAGNDIFFWGPGDGSDTIEGQEGTDKLLFFGSNASENLNIFANAGRVGLFRDVASITMDMDDVENLELRALGGADNIVIGDLTGTDLNRIELDLRGPNGGTDGEVDSITVHGTQGSDNFAASGDSGGVFVTGLSTQINIFQQDGAQDRLILNGQGGDDVIRASSLEADGIRLAIHGGLGNDLLTGSDGDDLITGGDGNDVAFLGAGDDQFVWNPGDDNDTIEGQDGRDEMLFNGSNIGEVIDISANGSRLRFFRDVANVTMDTDDVEVITFNALGGADTVVVHDLAGTDVTELNLNLSSFAGVSDGAADTVILEGTASDDVFLAFGDASGTSILGLAASLNITGTEGGSDRLILNGLGGDDVMDATALADSAFLLTLSGGDGNDILLGGDGADTLLGGDGDDVLIGGLSLDILDGGLGDDIEIQ